MRDVKSEMHARSGFDVAESKFANEPTHMRLFTAIDIPDDIKDRLQAVVDRLRPTAKLTWSPVQNLHLTLKFIGEWPETRLRQLQQALASLPSPGPIEIAVRGLGWFPNPRNPRVFWAGIESGVELTTLARETEQILAGIGVPVEQREFHPHLTLARRRNPVPLEELRRTLAIIPSDDFGSFRPAYFYLYLSAGGKYTKLQEYPLTSI